MDLSNSKYLIEMPSFEGIPKLVQLNLTGCTNLSQVHPSVGLLKELAFLSLRNCSSLASLNLSTASDLSSLLVLHLSGCTKLENTPNFKLLSNLEHLDLEQCTSLSTVDDSIWVLAKLKFLSLRHCTNLVRISSYIKKLSSLITLDLYGCVKLRNLPPIRASMSFLCIIVLDLGFCNLRQLPYGIGELRCLERLNLEGNNLVSLPLSIRKLSSTAYLNLSHCHELQFLPRFPALFSPSTVGRYFKTLSGSRNRRSGLYIFHCPKLLGLDGQRFALSWLIRLMQEPRHFRCGFDILIPGSVIPEWFNHQFKGDSIIRILHADVNDNWIGFAFCVLFEVDNGSGMSLYSSSLPLPHPFCLSFESEHVEESFDMPLCLDVDKIDGSMHLWQIYISQPHCHFVKTGACITFKARPGLKVREWGLRMVFKQDIQVLKRNLGCVLRTPNGYIRERNNSSSGPEIHLPYNRLAIEHVHESSNSVPKIQLPYNWLITEEDENEKIEAEEKENNLSNLAL